MMWYWGGGVQWWGWLLMSLGMVAFWGLIIWAVWFFVTGLTRWGDRPNWTGGAKQVLDERLARGEIDPEAYLRLRDLMRHEDVHAGDGRSTWL